MDIALDELFQGVEPASAWENLQEDTRSIIELAQKVRSYWKVPEPKFEYERASKQRILRAIRQSRRGQFSKRKSSRRGNRLFRPATIPIAVTLAFLLLLSSTGIASANALPGDSLYGLKRGLEETRLFLTVQSDKDARLLAQFASERIDEANRLADAGKNDEIEKALDTYVDLIGRLETLAMESDGINLQMISEVIERQTDQLEQLNKSLGSAAPPALENAILKSNHGQEVLEYKEQGGNPSDLAPGQLKKSEDEEKEKDKKPKKEKKPKPDPQE